MTEINTPSGAGKRAVAATLGLSALTFMLLILPDAVFALLGWPITDLTKPKSVLVVAAIAMVLTLVASRPVRLAVVAFLVANQIIWLGSLTYFGKTLSPEQFLLAQFETQDILKGIGGELWPLVQSTALVAAVGAGLATLQWPQRAGRVWRHQTATWSVLVLLIGGSAFCFFHRKVNTLYPGPQTPSVIGAYQAMLAATRVSLAAATTGASLGIRDQAVRPLPIPEEPVTVVVIMGESITASRLSIFGHDRETTPTLKAWLAEPPPGFTLLGKPGFAGGVATFGSVPSFLRMAFWPVDATRRGISVFDLAAANGFESWYLSAQSRFFLELAGGAPEAKRIVAEEDIGERLAAVNDDVLVEMANEIPSGAARRFVFFHERVNHAPYSTSCEHVAREVSIFPPEEGHEANRRVHYDNGLRCWDRNAGALARRFLSEKGAVHIFITADHAELMGEGGLWGHSMADLRAATVPFLLLTNRPDGDVARAFAKMTTPTTYRLAQVVARALGHDVSTPDIPENKFFLNTTMPFATAGYMEVDELRPGAYRVQTFSRDGRRLSDVEHDNALVAQDMKRSGGAFAVSNKEPLINMP